MDVHPLPARALIAAALLASCGESAEVFEEPRTVEVAVIPAMWSPKLDILVVVGDRSGSEVLQYQLGRDIDALIAPLRAAAGSKFDLHVGVTTTDLGTTALVDPDHPAPPFGQVGVGGCAGAGGDGALVTSGAPVRDDFLIDAYDPFGDNFTGPVNDALTQMVRVGSDGCDYEQPLSAAVRALARDPLVGFRRLPDANLLVVIATTADDCSLHDAALLDPARTDLGRLQTFRCVQHGLVCDEDLGEAGVKHHCAPAPGYLEDLAFYREQLRHLSPDPTRLAVGMLAGPREPIEVGFSTYPDGSPRTSLAPACRCTGSGGNSQPLDPAPRLAAFADVLGARGVAAPACGEDLSPALGEVARVGKQLFGVACLDPSGMRDSSTEPGIQPACHATLVQHGVERDLPACPSDGDCFALISDEIACPRSPDYLRFAVNYATAPGADTYVRARCEVPL